jgi:hypothetical protein
MKIERQITFTIKENSLIVAAILFFAGISQFIWVLLDKSVWPFDPSWYAEETLLISIASRASLDSWFYEMINAFGTKAPLIAWIGQLFVPFSWLGIPIEQTLLIVPIGSWLISSYLLYKIARIVWQQSSLAPIATLFVCISSPVALGMSRLYFVESMQLLPITACIYLSISKKTRLELVLWSIAAVSIALLAKNTTVMHIVVPGLVILFKFYKPSLEPLEVRKIFVPALTSLFCFLGCFGWYYVNWQKQFDFMKSASSGSIGLLYGSKAPFIEKLAFWIPEFQVAFFITPLFYIFLALFLYIIFNCFFLKKNWTQSSFVFGILVFIQGALQLTLLSNQIVEEPRYLLTMTPYVALLIGFLVSELDQRIGKVLIVFLVMQSVICVGYSFGFSVPFTLSRWLHPVEYSPKDQNLLSSVITRSCPQDKKNSYHIIGQEMPSFNANSASFYGLKEMALRKSDHRCFYTSLGYAETDPLIAWNRIQAMNAQSVIFRNDFLPQQMSPAFNAVSKDIQDRLENSAEFKLIKEDIPVELTYFERNTKP